VRILFVDNHDVFARTVTDAFLAAHQVEIVPTVDRAKEALATGSTRSFSSTTISTMEPATGWFAGRARMGTGCR